MKPLRPVGIVLAVILANACSRHSESLQGGEVAPTHTAKTIAAAITHARAERVCRTQSPGGPPQSVIALTAKQCLSCLDVGNLLREAQRHAAQVQTDLRVAVASDEVDEVCAFMSREKVRLPVLAIPREDFPRGEGVGQLFYFEPAPDGTVHRLETAETGLQLLEKIRGPVTPSSAPAR